MHSAIHMLDSPGSLVQVVGMALEALLGSQDTGQDLVVQLVAGYMEGMGQLGPGQDMVEDVRGSCRMPSVSCPPYKGSSSASLADGRLGCRCRCLGCRRRE